METAKLKKFAQFARRSLLEQVSAELELVLTENSATLYRKAGKKSEYIRQAGFAPIQQEQMVLNYIDKHGSIKRAEVMDLCHLDRNQAYRMLVRMKEAGQIKQIGEHKGAVYERI